MAPETGPSDSVANALRADAKPGVIPLTPAAMARRADLAWMVRALVRRIAGSGVRMTFAEDLGLANEEGWGTVNADGQAIRLALYDYGERLIEFSFIEPHRMGETALHEAYHDVEVYLLTDREYEVMLRETGRLREYVLKQDPRSSRPQRYTRDQVDSMAG